MKTIIFEGGPCDGQPVRRSEDFLLQLDDMRDPVSDPVIILKSWHSTWHRYQLDEVNPSMARYIGPEPARWT